MGGHGCMSTTVFILGAGASRDAGAPLMNDFLDVAERLLVSGKAGHCTKDFRFVFDALSHLQETQSKFALTFHNVEAAFAAFEVAGIVEKLGGMDAEKIERLPSAMRRLIYRTLELTVCFPRDANGVRPPLGYRQLVELITKIHPGNPWQRSSIITFNYDIALDYALRYEGIPVDYCLSERRSAEALALMKLHGSLNWRYCEKCPHLSPWEIGEYFRDRRFLGTPPDSVTLEVASAISDLHHECGESYQPFIVPPTWNKTIYKSHLQKVWAAAAAELSAATEILVMGYSLPETDVFFKHLLALGTASKTRINKFWVFDPDERVEQRFRNLLGPAARERFQFHRTNFGQGMAELEMDLKSAPGIA
jgi:hypothetical protein